MAIYQNPIIGGFNPDPSVVCVGDDFYLVTSSFEFYPGVPIYHSQDLINWEQIGFCLDRQSQLPLTGCVTSGGIWAPTIRYNDGVFYMTTTNNVVGKNFYVTATDPKGPWSEPIWVELGGIDPSIFFNDDGKVYFTANPIVDGQDGIWCSEIDIKTGILKEPPHHLWSGTGRNAPEGGHLYKINGWYYLMIAEGGTGQGHSETIARSKEIYGEYEPCPHNPILTNRGMNSCIQATGHADLVQAKDNSWWVVFLGVRFLHGESNPLGRETFLAPVKWENGWPIVYDGKMIQPQMEADLLPQKKTVEKPIRSTFESLGFEWNFLRNPNDEDWRLENGKLVLKGSSVNLEDLSSPAFVGRRQSHPFCTIKTKISFNPANDNEEAGITAYMSYGSHYDLAITKINGTLKLIVRRVMGDMNFVAWEQEINCSDLVLSIKATPENYIFGFGTNENDIQYLYTANTKFISPPCSTAPFTGMYLAMYATGNDKPCENEAYFDWFDYEID